MGMVNLGNTCYLGAVLVGLLHVGESFWGLLKNANAEPLPDSAGTKGDWVRFLAELHSHAWSGERKDFEPRDVWTTLRRAFPDNQFTMGLQHDAQEALACILDGLNSSLAVGQQSKKKSPSGKGAQWIKYLAEHKSTLVPEAFHGLLKSTLACPRKGCGGMSSRFDGVVIWSLPLLRKIEVTVMRGTTPTAHAFWVERTASADQVREMVMKRFGKKSEHVFLFTSSGTHVSGEAVVPKSCVAAFGVRGRNFGIVFKADGKEHSDVLDRPLEIFGHVYYMQEELVDKAAYTEVDVYHKAVMKKSLEERNVIKEDGRTYSYDFHSCTVVNAETQWYVARVKTNEIPGVPVCENADERLTLEMCLEQFFKPETLGEKDMVICGKCNERGRATKTLQPEHLPDVLLIQLKRFVHEGHGLYGKKVRDPVVFQDTLDVPKVFKDRYRLKAVTFHHGYGLSSGHYTCTAKVGDEWYNFDDSTVTKTDLDEDRTSETKSAYILFYERTQGDEKPSKRQRRNS